MALPTTNNPISFNQINVELGVAGTTQRSMNDSVLRTLFGVASGAISMSNGWGKSSITAGSQTFTSSGTFTVPAFNTLTVVVQGGGGAGYHADGFFYDGVSLSGTSYANIDNGAGAIGMANRYGGTSSFGAYLTATGGQCGRAASTGSGSPGVTMYGGAGGTGSGGDQNYTGSSGASSPSSWTGGSIPASEGLGGAAGGYGVYASGGAQAAQTSFPSSPGASGPAYNVGITGSSYGGGGSGGTTNNKLYGLAIGGGGGGGGLARKTWTNQALAAGSTIAVTVGAGHPQPYLNLNDGVNIMYGSAGAPGIVFMSWS